MAPCATDLISSRFCHIVPTSVVSIKPLLRPILKTFAALFLRDTCGSNSRGRLSPGIQGDRSVSTTRYNLSNQLALCPEFRYGRVLFSLTLRYVLSPHRPGFANALDRKLRGFMQRRTRHTIIQRRWVRQSRDWLTGYGRSRFLILYPLDRRKGNTEPRNTSTKV